MAATPAPACNCVPSRLPAYKSGSSTPPALLVRGVRDQALRASSAATVLRPGCTSLSWTTTNATPTARQMRAESGTVHARAREYHIREPLAPDGKFRRTQGIDSPVRRRHMSRCEMISLSSARAVYCTCAQLCFDQGLGRSDFAERVLRGLFESEPAAKSASSCAKSPPTAR
jgi:hypothetical protein